MALYALGGYTKQIPLWEESCLGAAALRRLVAGWQSLLGAGRTAVGVRGLVSTHEYCTVYV